MPVLVLQLLARREIRWIYRERKHRRTGVVNTNF